MSYRVKYPGLELSWLRRHDRTLVVPEVVFAEVDAASGYYVHPRAGGYEVGGLDVDCSRGILVVHSLDEAELHASTLAHEWRHHWQFHQGWPADGAVWNPAEDPRPYEERIVDFLRRYPNERDAVRFEHGVAPNWVTNYWIELFKKDCRTVEGGRTPWQI